LLCRAARYDIISSRPGLAIISALCLCLCPSSIFLDGIKNNTNKELEIDIHIISDYHLKSLQSF